MQQSPVNRTRAERLVAPGSYKMSHSPSGRTFWSCAFLFYDNQSKYQELQRM